MSNPLAMSGPRRPNPLMAQAAPPQQQGPQVPQNMAGAIQGMNMDPAQMQKMAALATYTAQELGRLARNPNVTQKDVVNAAGQAVADGMVTAPDAVKWLSQAPQDPAQLKGWLDHLYMQNLSAAVHMKAMLAGGVQPQQQAPQAPAQAMQQPMPQQPAPMSPQAPPAPGNAPEPMPTSGV
jgi:hypothetical protein